MALDDERNPLANPFCTTPVTRPSMLHRWDQLTFLHWGYEPREVQRLLPAPLQVETYDGRAWVGLVPFIMEVKAPRGPALPWLSRFPETNVRTYVRAPTARPGCGSCRSMRPDSRR